MVSRLSDYDLGCSSRIRIPDPGVKKAPDPDPKHWQKKHRSTESTVRIKTLNSTKRLPLSCLISIGLVGTKPKMVLQVTGPSYQGCGSAFISSGSGYDPAFYAEYWSGSGSNTDPYPIRIRGFNDQKLEKTLQLKKKILFSFSKTTIHLSLSLHKERPSYRRSLQLSKEAIQHFKTRLNPDPIGIRIRNPASYRVVDPDPQLYGQVGPGSGVTVPDPTLMRIRILLLTIMQNHATLITESEQA